MQITSHIGLLVAVGLLGTCARLVDATLPGKVSNVRLTAQGDEPWLATSVYVRWDAPTVGTDPILYDVASRLESGGSYSTHSCADPSATNCLVSDLDVGTPYVIRISASNADGSSGAYRTYRPPPGEIEDIFVFGATSSSVSFNWEDVDGDTDGYESEYRTKDSETGTWGSWVPLGQSTDAVAIVTSLESGMTIHFRARGYNGASVSSWTEVYAMTRSDNVDEQYALAVDVAAVLLNVGDSLSTVQELETVIEAQQATIDELVDTLDSLQSSLATRPSVVASMQSGVANDQDEIDSIDSAFESVEDVQDSVGPLAAQLLLDVQALRSEISSLEDRASTQSSDLVARINLAFSRYVDINAQNTAVDDLLDSIDSFESNILSVYSSLVLLVSRLGALDSEMSGLVSDLQGLDDELSVNSLLVDDLYSRVRIVHPSPTTA